MKNNKRFILLLLILTLFSVSVSAQVTISDIPDNPKNNPFKSAEQRITGKVVRVADGDTITVLDKDNHQNKIRFEGIDAPESKQDFGQKSKENLSNWVFGKEVTVITSKIDKYKRHVGKVMLGDIDINLEQIKAGLAWHYKKYADEQIESDQKLYAEEELKAQNAKIGLWAQPNATAPWDWRSGKDNANLDGVPEGSILGNTNSKIYHTPGCGTYAKVSAKNRRIFATEAEAVKAGYRIAKNCESTLSADDMPPVTEQSAPGKTTATKPTKKSGDDGKREYLKGSKGGCYYLTDSGKKKYVDRSFCDSASDTNTTKDTPTTAPTGKSDDSGRTYVRGSRGGCYYLNGSGKKVYVDRSLCGSK